MSENYKDGDVVIIDGYRTPVGNLNGCFSSLKAHDLGAVVIKKLIAECNVNPEDVSEVILGQALTAGICFHCVIQMCLRIKNFVLWKV